MSLIKTAFTKELYVTVLVAPGAGINADPNTLQLSGAGEQYASTGENAHWYDLLLHIVPTSFTGAFSAGNASPLSDGASGLLIGSAAVADRLNRTPLARIAGRGAFANEPQFFGYAPVEAANLALRRAGISWADVGAVELNEAFAVQPLACIKAWRIDPDIVNVKGGAIAIGHPLGASGGRLLGTLAAVLSERGQRWGVAAICIGVGQALAVVIENLNTQEGPRP